MTIRYNIVIADDHELIRDALSLHIQMDDSLNLVACVGDGDELRQAVDDHATGVDVVVMDYDMPGGGVITIDQIKLEHPDLRLLVVTGVTNGDVLRLIQRSKADAILQKTGESGQIIDMIKRLATGDIPATSTGRETKAIITHKEYQVLCHVAEGSSNTRIAELMNISPKTVDSHRQSVMRKLDAHSAPELVRKALQLRILTY